MKMIKKHKLVGLVLMLAVIITVSLAFQLKRALPNIISGRNENLIKANALASQIDLTVEELSEFDGTDPEKPIYIGMEGYIYDVTQGKKYYQPDGSYHYLAGKDSTIDLKIAGGDIIKKKYPVVGRILD